MTVQDDERERELVRLFNLDWDPAHQRSGVDAILKVEFNGVARSIDVEVKSSTGRTVSTARDVGMEHISRWRTKMFVVGFYTRAARRPELITCLCLTPADMEPWIAALEAKIAIDFKIAERGSQALKMGDLWAVCGKKPYYTIAEARQVLKQQWSTTEYLTGADVRVGGEPCLSPQAMLDVLRRRSRYIAQRGATLNNPHVPRAHLSKFAGSSREVREDWAASIRKIALEWLPSTVDPWA